VSTVPAILIGFAAGMLCYLALSIKERFKLDDALDVLAVHLVGGLFGSVVLGLFAERSINHAVTHQGVFFGGGGRLLVDQFVAAGATFAFSFAVTFAIAKLLDVTVGLRITPEQEDIGMDQSLHAETAYATAEFG
jgi:Amt family ammonium transporter